MVDKLPTIIGFWRTMRDRLNFDAKLAISPTANQLHMLLCHLGPDDIVTYDIRASTDELAKAVSIAMTEGVVPAALVEALDDLESTFENETVADWPAQVISVIGNPEASLETKVSACELALLYGLDDNRTTVLDQVDKVFNAYEATYLPNRTQLAIGLFSALTGQYPTDEETDAPIEYLSHDVLDAAVEILNRWRLRGRLWSQVRTSKANKMRDGLLRALHDAHPTARYAGVQPGHFQANEIPTLESRVGRPVLVHLATQPKVEAWTQHISSLDLGAGQLPLLDLVMEAQEDGKQLIMETVNTELSQIAQVTFSNNLTQREDGYASLFDLERHGTKVAWPDAFYEAAAEVLTQKGWILKSSKISKVHRVRILAGVWSKIVSGKVNVPTSLLQDHIGPYVQSRYNYGGREQFTEKVLPAMIRGRNQANLVWAVDFLFARHRKKSTIPSASDAVIQAAITHAYPRSQGDIKHEIERLADREWFSLPSRPES